MTNQLIPVGPYQDLYAQLIELAVNAVDSPNSKRAYRVALEEFIDWYEVQGRPTLNKATVQSYKTSLMDRGLAPSTINVKLSAIRRFVQEAADNGLLDQLHANGIKAVKGMKTEGNRTGNWLSKVQTQELLEAPNRHTLKGKRDAAILAVLIGAALRRDEAARLEVQHLQQRDGTWGIVDIEGKRGKIRSVPVPVWVRNVVQSWLDMARIDEGFVFRPLRKGDWMDKTRRDSHLSGNAIWKVVRIYCEVLGLDITPHDLRRTAAKLMLQGGAPLEQISLILGHADLKTTQRYLGIDLNWDDPATHYMGLTSPLKGEME